MKNDNGSNFVEHIREWVSAGHSIYGKMEKGTLQIWTNSHIFQKHYNFHKISIDNALMVNFVGLIHINN